jgi:hypothetical protein
MAKYDKDIQTAYDFDVKHGRRKEGRAREQADKYQALRNSGQTVHVDFDSVTKAGGAGYGIWSHKPRGRESWDVHRDPEKDDLGCCLFWIFGGAFVPVLFTAVLVALVLL